MRAAGNRMNLGDDPPWVDAQVRPNAEARESRRDGATALIRFPAVPLLLALAGCGPSYSPDSYASSAVQQANKVEAGVIVGVRPVLITASGTVGGLTGGAAGGIAGAQLGVGPTSAFTALGGTLLGGLAGATAERVVGDTNGFEYIVRKPNGEMISVAQKEPKPLPLGQKVLVIAGNQARIIADYTVPAEPGAKPAAPAPSPPVPSPPAPSAASPGDAPAPPGAPVATQTPPSGPPSATP